MLARTMNTSVEQLLTTYIGMDESDFENTARELVRIVDVLYESDKDGDVSHDQTGRGLFDNDELV